MMHTMGKCEAAILCSQWKKGDRKLYCTKNMLMVLRDLRVLGKARVPTYRRAVLNSLCSGILIGQVERSDLTGKDCVSLNA